MNKTCVTILMVLTVMLGSRIAYAVKIADITRIYGQQNNVLTGIGLVYGLKGTGDGGDYMPAMRPLQAMLEKYNNPATLQELSKSANVALVTVTVTLPSNGVRRGDRFDCQVTTLGAAGSLRGGQLIMTPLTAKPGGVVYGLANGTVVIEDSSTPTGGVIKGGFQSETNLSQPMIQGGRFITFIIDDAHASWGLASTMAKLINEAEAPSGELIAVARDPRTIEVTIPDSERQYPDSFIARIQRLPLPLIQQEARVVINTKTSTIIVTGDVEISPVVVSYKGLTITTITPKPIPNERNPIPVSLTSVPVETGATGGAKLQDLVNALEQLRVPTDDRINIIKELHKSGKLHARLIVDGVTP